MKILNSNLIYCASFCLLSISSHFVSASDRNTFPTSRIGGGTRGECGSRLLIHIVPSANKYLPDKNRLLAVYLGKTKHASPLIVKLLNNKNSEHEMVFKSLGESLLIFKIPKTGKNTLWKSYFKCSEKYSDNMYNFISNNSNPVSTYISSKDNIENKKYRKFINKAYNTCGNSISKQDIATLTNLNQKITNKISKEVRIICL